MLKTTFTQFESPKRQSKLPEVFWLEHGEAEVPEGNSWLSEREIARLRDLRFAKRRSDWRLGRWTAKCAVKAYLGAHKLQEIEIIAASDGAPEVWLRSQGNAPAISISHRNGIAICAVACAGMAVGCDLEAIEPRSNAFISDYFTDEEQETIRAAVLPDRPLLANLFWSAKESALKALRAGLRRDTRSLTVVLRDATITRGVWHSLKVQSDSGEMFPGWWRADADMLRTVVASSAQQSPISLSLPKQ